ncbi:MAG: helix-turn-helix domain-containing protein [Lachnospiraceae bacterium]|nr:helix-turn-helix domain-containing protein [Lachnospiraceae bacterium]
MQNTTLEQYLKDLRKAFNYSQEFVASHLNITRQTYSHYETGRITPPVNSLYNLAKLYGIPVENFLDLVVTYNINMDFAQKNQTVNVDLSDDLTNYLEYTSTPAIQKKIRNLDHKERLLIYYFLQLDQRDQDDILTFLKVKLQNRASEKNST